MTLREQIKKEIDSIPEEYLPQIKIYLNLLRKKRKAKTKKIKTLSLGGKYDDINVRKIAYE